MKKLALIVNQYGMFQVRAMDEHGMQITLASDENLQECLLHAALTSGPLVIPISTETTDF